MDSLIKELEKPKRFDAFIQEQMKNSTYVAEWKSEMPSPEYCASKVYNTYVAEYAAAMVGSVIDKNGEKPTHQMPTAKQLIGSLSRIADEWQMDNDRLDQYYILERRYRDKQYSFSQEQRNVEYAKLVKFLFDPFEKAVIAPHKRIDMLYFEGLFNGTQTVNDSNNTKSDVTYTYKIGVKKFYAKVAAWGNENSTPLDDIQEIVDYLGSQGKTVMKMRMSVRTFRKMCKSKQLRDVFKLKLGKVDVSAARVSYNEVNQYLESILLPTITIEKERYCLLADGKSTNMTKDDRVVFQCANTVAVLKVADTLESVDPLPNKTYSTYDNNQVGMWRNEKGRFIDYEMWAHPVFTGKEDYFILETDKTEAEVVKEQEASKV